MLWKEGEAPPPSFPTLSHPSVTWRCLWYKSTSFGESDPLIPEPSIHSFSF